ncbi:uncharacterized protein TNCV_1707641 [Trichonephila clavipes]|uniref:Uncharacterized protein n=1 Tax=Trichonephila clavipes TaxID=2585209 RepID=A0A8X6UYG5_TRICX|nr:uncharacterized protein TNCV_1707641 [Trichonephila clavipes]
MYNDANDMMGGVNFRIFSSSLNQVQHNFRGHGILGIKVSDRGSLATNLSPVPLKTYRVGQRCTLNLSRAQTSSHWCGVVVRRGGCQLRCCPRNLTIIQNYEVHRQKPSLS